jgi:DNA-binding beta-propeller fold protein YncE
MRVKLARTAMLAGFAFAAACQSTSVAGANQPASHQRSSTGERTHAPLFGAPTALAFDVKRNVYVADASQARVVKLSPLAHLLMEWGKQGAGSGNLAQPSGITADALGHVYVADRKRSLVIQYGYGGKLLANWGGQQFASPASLAIDAGGNVYVADAGHNRIAVLSTKGKIIASWNGVNGLPVTSVNRKGRPVKAKKKPLVIGRLAHPDGVFVDFKGHIFIADTGHNRVVELSTGGVPLHSWGASGTGDAHFSQPESVAVDLHGNIWVSDTGNNRVVELSPKGRTEAVLGGSKSSAAGSFNGPRGLAVDGRGNLYVADSGNGRIEKFAAAGHQAIAVWK